MLLSKSWPYGIIPRFWYMVQCSCLNHDVEQEWRKDFIKNIVIFLHYLVVMQRQAIARHCFLPRDPYKPFISLSCSLSFTRTHTLTDTQITHLHLSRFPFSLLERHNLLILLVMQIWSWFEYLKEWIEIWEQNEMTSVRHCL